MKIKLFSGLRSKLIVSFAVILLLPSIVVGSLAYNSAKDQIQNQIFTSVNENVKLVNTLIDNSIKPKVNDIVTFRKPSHLVCIKAMTVPNFAEFLKNM